MSQDESIFGKKIFFLNPPAVLVDVLNTLASAEFEVYTAHDKTKLARFIKKNPRSIVYVNVDEGDDEPQWRTWIATQKEQSTPEGPGFGVITMMSDKDKQEAYLMSLGVECGLITLKTGTAKTAEILLKTLEANEARGRRRYVRANIPAEGADFNVQDGNELLRGSIQDLSVVGMSANFGHSRAPQTGSRLKSIQLNLKGARIIVNGIVIGGRKSEDESAICVIMFEPASLDDDKRTKMRGFIRKTLQAAMDQELEYA